MTNTLVCRSVLTDMGVRSGEGGDGRTIFGLSVPFGVSIEMFDWWDGEYTEDFARGSFAKTITERGDKVKFLGQHDSRSQMPLGKATVLREDPAGLYSEFRVSKTQRGDELIELVRDGAMDSLSIGFVPVSETQTKTDGKLHITRTEVSLREVSAVTFAAYDGTATIDGVRGAHPASALSAVQEALRMGRAAPPLALAALDAWRAAQGAPVELLVDVEAERSRSLAVEVERTAADMYRLDMLALSSR